MIKSIFLNQRGKTSSLTTNHCTYSEATKMGVLYNVEEFNDEIIEEVKELLEEDGKSVSKLGFTETPTENTLLFHKKDISGMGSIKKHQVSSFVNESFDFLISLNTSEDMNYRYVLALSKATCKVGIGTDEYSNLLQMSFKPEADKQGAVKNILKYLKMIRV